MRKVAIKEIVEIPLNKLVVNLAPVRVTSVGRYIRELAESTRKSSLLSPIIVCPADEPGKYEIIAGQRRFLAHRELRASTIMAAILDRKLDKREARMVFLHESTPGQPLTRKEMSSMTGVRRKKGVAAAKKISTKGNK